jgi:hypothetical protein
MALEQQPLRIDACEDAGCPYHIGRVRPYYDYAAARDYQCVDGVLYIRNHTRVFTGPMEPPSNHSLFYYDQATRAQCDAFLRDGPIDYSYGPLTGLPASPSHSPTSPSYSPTAPIDGDDSYYNDPSYSPYEPTYNNDEPSYSPTSPSYVPTYSPDYSSTAPSYSSTAPNF